MGSHMGRYQFPRYITATNRKPISTRHPVPIVCPYIRQQEVRFLPPRRPGISQNDRGKENDHSVPTVPLPSNSEDGPGAPADGYILYVSRHPVELHVGGIIIQGHCRWVACGVNCASRGRTVLSSVVRTGIGKRYLALRGHRVGRAPFLDDS